MKLPSAAVALTMICCAAPAMAQRGGFDVPKAGTQLPAVTVYDEDGKKFSTRDLKGDYAVLVFGCLT